MVKKIAIVTLILAGAVFAFDWGVYLGPGVNLGLVDMDPIHDAIVEDAASDEPNFPGYDVTGFDNFQIGLATPITIRLWNFTIGWNDIISWSTFEGADWKTAFTHYVNITEFGFIINLDEHMRLRPMVGLGDYDIDMRIAETGGGFGDPGDAGISRSYDYDNYAFSAGAAFSYIWKFENNILVGIEAKARYLVPLRSEDTWSADGSYDPATIYDFYPHTPLMQLNFVLGYEHLGSGSWLWNEEDEWDEAWEQAE